MQLKGRQDVGIGHMYFFPLLLLLLIHHKRGRMAHTVKHVINDLKIEGSSLEKEIYIYIYIYKCVRTLFIQIYTSYTVEETEKQLHIPTSVGYEIEPHGAW